jgi:hypothetical protein
MRGLAWLVFFGAIAGIVWYVARLRRQWAERREAAEARMVSLMGQAQPAAPPPLAAAPAAPPAQAPEERLLLDAAGKVVAAGEPALAIQLYARLLSRFPATLFAAQARAAVEEQKKKLAKT